MYSISMVLFANNVMFLRFFVLRPVVREHPYKDGGDAASQHVLDRGPVPKESSRHPVSMSTDAHVHLRLRFLPPQEQPEYHL